MSTKRRKIPPGSYLLPISDPHCKTTPLLERVLGEKIKIENNPDVYLLDQETVGIPQIREVKRFLSLKRWHSLYQVVIIRYQKRITVEAQNSLLKILEEPGQNRYFFILTPNPNQLLSTILSRCQILKTSLTKSTKSVTQNELLNREKLIELSLDPPDNNQLQETIHNTITFFQKKLLQVDTHRERKLLSGKIRNLNQAILMLKANVDSQSVIDWLLLSTFFSTNPRAD